MTKAATDNDRTVAEHPEPGADLPAESLVTALAGIGPGAAEKLKRLGIGTVRDLILHLPFRYEDRTRSVPLSELAVGEEQLVTGQVQTSRIVQGRRRALLTTIGDGHGVLNVRLFHFGARQRQILQSGGWMRCFGEVRAGPQGLEMVHPEYRLHAEEPPAAAPELTPVYRVTQGLVSRRLAMWVQAALTRCDPAAFSVNAQLAAGNGSAAGAQSANRSGETGDFAALFDAVRFLHAPTPNAEAMAAARARIILDELVGHYLVMKRRREWARAAAAVPLPPRRQLGRLLLRQLGFRLTRAQARVTAEVLNDMAGGKPMMRLLQGDVGAGKTVVAAFAAVRAAEHDCQVALMAPTEILAEQHFETLSEWLSPLGIGVGLLTGRQTAAERRARRNAVRDGDDLVAVGTHALFQAGVEFHDLGLAIIDEQHRFGVHQRLLLRDRRTDERMPHQLVMTATPIPRTLTMALYADMDVSTIDELPPGRKPVKTRVASLARRGEVLRQVRRACAAGRQAYWVCTLIEADEEDPRQAAETTFQGLSAEAQDLRFGLAHGRLPANEKAAVMASFKAGDIDVLVATTVVEVGVDVPNATCMVIANAERLGLAQLHQLRGRVGRGGTQSVCVLLYEPPLSAVARERLRLLRMSGDGFAIAEKDLELRGPGEMLGTRQTGEQTFKLADLSADRALVPKAVRVGDRLLAEDEETVHRVVATWARGEVEYASV